MRVVPWSLSLLASAWVVDARAEGCFPDAVDRCDALTSTPPTGAAPARPRALSAGRAALLGAQPTSFCAPVLAMLEREEPRVAASALERLRTTPCAEDAAVLTARLALGLHVDALAGDPAAARLALSLYDDIVPRLPTLTRLPAIVAPASLHLARAHLLFAKGDAERALGSYDDARLAGAAGDDLGQAIHGAGLAAAALVATGADAVPRTAGAALDRWACATASRADHEIATRARERMLVREGRHREAAALAYALAVRTAAAARGEDAQRFVAHGQLVATRADSDLCWSEVAHRSAILGRLACERPGETCEVVARAEHGARVRLVEKRAARLEFDDEPERRALELADEAMAVAEACALTRIREGERPRCEAPERILARAADLYERGKVPLRAVRVRTLLLDPRHRLDGTEEAELGMLRIASVHESLSDFDEAASWLEAFALTKRPRVLRASAAAHAAELRAALGEVDQAARDAVVLGSLTSSPRERAPAALAVARAALGRGEAQLALSVLRGVADRSEADVDDRVEALSIAGRAFVVLHDLPRARSALRRSVDTWLGGGERTGRSAEAAGRAALSLAALADKKTRPALLREALGRASFPAAVRADAALQLADVDADPRAALGACRKIARDEGLVDGTTRACSVRLGALVGARAEGLDAPVLVAPILPKTPASPPLPLVLAPSGRKE